MSKNVYVFAEQRDGNIQKVAYELVGKARELADTLDEKVYAVLVGQGMDAQAGSLIAARGSKSASTASVTAPRKARSSSRRTP